MVLVGMSLVPKVSVCAGEIVLVILPFAHFIIFSIYLLPHLQIQVQTIGLVSISCPFVCILVSQ